MLLADKWIRRLCVLPGEPFGPLDSCYIVPNPVSVRSTKQAHWLTVDKPMIEPFTESISGNGIVSYGLTSSGYDLRLGGEIYRFKNSGEKIDPRRFLVNGYLDKVYNREVYELDAEVVIPAHDYILGVSMEYLRIPNFLSAKCTGKSTLARCGIIINDTPMEAEWEGHLTIEIGNVTPCPVAIRVGEGICQARFELLNDVPELTYANKNQGQAGIYQGQRGVTPPRVRK